ncbi:MAG: hypothetical protein JO139_12725 [Alphaproteobacteria bacterium]|nr:hypothetical protein [Alphaproteobacteria bacterium]
MISFRPECGTEGDICAFELPRDAFPIVVEAPTGRMMTIAPGDRFLATPGCRESTRWASGLIPAGGLVPGNYYWVLADCGVIGQILGDAPLELRHLTQVRYLGAVCGDCEETLNIRQFAVTAAANSDYKALVYLLLGTSGDSGKTTAGIAVLRALRMRGYTTVLAMKATGTPSFEEIARYRDFGATLAFDCIDFGLPTTYPSGRRGITDVFERALDFCFSLPAEALVVECGGDIFGANVPEFLSCLNARRSDLKIILAAGDALGAMGAQQALAEMGLTISLITGPCTDTRPLRERTQALCGVPAINLVRGPEWGEQSDHPTL